MGEYGEGRRRDEEKGKGKGAFINFARKMTLCTAVGGGVGAASGAALAVLRSQSVPFYSVRMAANFAFMSSSFLGVSEAFLIARGRKTQDMANSSAAGGFVGFLAGAHFRGPRHGLVTGAALGCIAAAGHLGLEQFRLYRNSLHAAQGAPAVAQQPRSEQQRENTVPMKLRVPDRVDATNRSWLPVRPISREEIERRRNSA